MVPKEHYIAEEDTDDEITEKLRRQGVKIGRGLIAPRVFWPSIIVIVAVTVIAIIWPQGSADAFSAVQGWIVADLSWFYMLVVGAFIVFAVVIALSKYGSIKLGREQDKPEFSVMSWFTMLFSAGMGIGLIFYGVGEPVKFATVDPKPGVDMAGPEGAPLAMAQTFMHWGLHPWAIYAVIGLALAFAIHRRGRPVSIRWALEPLFGERVKGWIGDVIDVLAIFGTVFGVATSLGLGVQQIATGMREVGIIDGFDTTLLVILIVVITFLATFSVVSGVGAGIKWLSNINISLAGILLVTMLVLGPTLFIFDTLVQSLGAYFANIMQMTVDVGAFQGDAALDWLAGNTIFYWGWWIAWAPFVGVFIARISRGRTVRQFIAGVLLVPTIVGFIWFAVMGGSGLFREFFTDNSLVDPESGAVEPEGSLFAVLGDLPLGQILSVMTIIIVALFFITSSDSGSLVVDMLSSGGHPNPPVWSRVLWAFLEGALAIALMIAGGLSTLQTGSLITAVPFSIILILMCIATVRAFRYEHVQQQHIESVERLERISEHLTEEIGQSLTDDPAVREYVDDRIDYRLSRTRGLRRPGTGEKPAQPRPRGER
ncbi:BCCT family transporter [Microbacterium halotolerans]|uniref:BCCT family transporter n=1 Tax=Microbacterium halotolerans TaxID=246613 RepID=UPI000E6AB1E3|nr:BCCT family transporter [Microbacterium halotolerans]